MRSIDRPSMPRPISSMERNNSWREEVLRPQVAQPQEGEVSLSTLAPANEGPMLPGTCGQESWIVDDALPVRQKTQYRPGLDYSAAAD